MSGQIEQYLEQELATLRQQLAALKAQSTEQWNETMRQKKAWADGKDAEPVAVNGWLPCPFCGAHGVNVFEGSTVRWRYAECKSCGARSGEVKIQSIGRYCKADVERLKTEWNKRSTPPTATALLGSIGDWVYERMQQADSDYHNYGDDTAEVYVTLKMVLSKIESMLEDASTDTNKSDTN